MESGSHASHENGISSPFFLCFSIYFFFLCRRGGEEESATSNYGGYYCGDSHLFCLLSEVVEEGGGGIGNGGFGLNLGLNVVVVVFVAPLLLHMSYRGFFHG